MDLGTLKIKTGAFWGVEMLQQMENVWLMTALSIIHKINVSKVWSLVVASLNSIFFFYQQTSQVTSLALKNLGEHCIKRGKLPFSPAAAAFITKLF